MYSEWLRKVLNSCLESVEQAEFAWQQRANSFFDEAESAWTDRASAKFCQHYLVEMRGNALKFIEGLRQQYGILIKALSFIEQAELKHRAINIHFDDFNQMCSDDESLISSAKENIKRTECEVDLLKRKMVEVQDILRQIC